MNLELRLTCPHKGEPCGFSPNHIAGVVPSRSGGSKLVYKSGGFEFVKETSEVVLAMIDEMAKKANEGKTI